VSIGCTRDDIGSKVDARPSETRNLHFFPFNQAFQVRGVVLCVCKLTDKCYDSRSLASQLSYVCYEIRALCAVIESLMGLRLYAPLCYALFD